MFGEWEVSATRPLTRGEILRCSDEIENERNHGNIPPRNSCRVRKRESRRKPEWKRKRNEDGSEWNRDMRFRLRLGAMNIPMGEAARPAKKTGSVWLEIFSQGAQAKTGSLIRHVITVPRSSRQSRWYICELKHNLFTPSAHPTRAHTPVCVAQRGRASDFWINCLEKTSCHPQTAHTTTTWNYPSF